MVLKWYGPTFALQSKFGLQWTLLNPGNRAKMRQFSNQRGFTIIELVMVLAVSSILVSFAILRIAPTLESARVRRSAALIATDLQYAQMIAARQRRPVVIIASEALRGYMIRDAASTTVYREAYLGTDTDFNLDQLEADPTTLEIFPNGVVRSAGSYTVRVNTVQRRVRITRAGQVRITSVP